MTFDTIIVVDWSAAQGVRRAEKDAIWIGVAGNGVQEDPIAMPTRLAAEAWLEARLRGEIAAGRRVMAGFDFPFGYPKGFARRVTGFDDPLLLWDWLAERITDDDRGRNNRYDVASALNRMSPGVGPFWGKPNKDGYPDIPYGGKARTGEWTEKRACDLAAKASSSVWQLAFPPTVGSQVLMGLPTLSRLRRIDDVAVWPFQPWQGARGVLAEIWPGLIEGALPPKDEGIRDRHQVHLLAQALAALDPGELTQMMEVQAPEEGWILGAGHRERLTELAMDAAQSPVQGKRPAPSALSNDCFALPPGVHWTPVDEALALLRTRLRPVVGVETVAVGAADGRVLARDHFAARSNPPGANAAVDGYGFAHGALAAGVQDVPLVAGRAAAGAPYDGVVPPGHAVRILTGALVPAGVDTVVLQEDCQLADGRVAFAALPKPGANTRKAGEDVVADALALPRSHVLRPPDLALLAAVGCGTVAVFQRLRVGVLSTGDELCAPSATAGPARTYDANRPMLLALAARWGCTPVDLGHVGDDRASLRARLDGAEADVVLTSGGASAGEEDHVSALLHEAGAMQAWRIALKPGRPLALGLWNGMAVFGLPGNPVAALVCALIFARPAMGLLAGAEWRAPVGFDVPAAFEKRKKAGRREYLRARIVDGRAEVFASEGSGRISGLSWAEGLVELSEPAQQVQPGDRVRFLPYGGFGF